MDAKTMKVDGRWFKERLAAKRITFVQAGKYLDLDPSSLSKTFKGTRRLQLEEAGKLARLINAPLNEVLTRAGMDVHIVTAKAPDAAPLVGTIDATHTVASIDRPGARVSRPSELPDTVVALVYQTARTKADMLDNWLVFVEPLAGTVNPNSIGRLAHVRLRDGREMVVFVRRGAFPGVHQLWDYTGPVMTEAQLNAANPVLLIRP